MLATIVFFGVCSAFATPTSKIGGVIISKKQTKNFLMPSFENKTAIENRLSQSNVDFIDEN
jgi:phosphoribosyl-AMP cyclohydrolase